MTHWTSDNYGYGAVYIRYLIDQYGETAIKNMCATDKVGVAAVEAATGTDFNTIFNNFTRALVLSGTGGSTNPLYAFTTLDLQTVQPNGRGGLTTTAVYTAGENVSKQPLPLPAFLWSMDGRFWHDEPVRRRDGRYGLRHQPVGGATKNKAREENRGDFPPAP
ncbi:MAG: hypothetical protein ACM3ZC_01855 [Bacteroidota bacterium]